MTSGNPGSLGRRLRDELRGARARLRPRLGFWSGLARILPELSFGSVRTELYRRAGCRIGAQSALLGSLQIVGDGDIASRLQIGEGCLIATKVTVGLDGEIVLGRNVSIGPGVTLYTATHSIGFGSRRMNYAIIVKPIHVGDGVWIGMNCLILPGVTIGAGSVIAAGSVVSEDVEPNSLVAGNPAQFVQKLPFGNR
ncbi:MAG: acyltransferase [Armatimonadota bacterium]